MTWLIFALGTALALAGAISIASGIPYIQVEWGWTETIAGAVAFSSGVITFALGAILYRLSAIQNVLRNGFDLLPTGVPDPQQTANSDDVGVPLSIDDSSQPAGQPLDPSRLGAPTAYPSADEIVGTGHADSSMQDPTVVEPSGPYPSETASGMPEAVSETVPQIDTVSARVPWTARFRSRFRRTDEPVPTTPVPGAGLGLQLRPTSDPDLSESDSAPRFDLSGQAHEPPGVSAEDPNPSGQSSEARQEAAGGGRAHGEGDDDAATGPTIVGRYEAAGVSYFLLSDGGIEVKTESGLHRFGSMQELKLFIEAQELQSSPRDR